ncbi:hypothetical protein ABE10_02545, partial [Bacillus toyonensis]|nr:hypothetical protein [Bacillus toyonensis]
QTLQTRGQLQLRGRGEVVRDVREGRSLTRHRLDEDGMGVPEGVDRDPAEEVEIATTVGVPDRRPFAAREQGESSAQAHQVVRCALLPIAHPATAS